MFLGLRTVIYPAANLSASRDWFTNLLGQEPYFDQPFYVGFNVGGYELGLLPDAPADRGPVTYWGVAALGPAVEAATAAGAELVDQPQDVGEGIKVAAVREPGGSLLGLIENPNFKLPDQTA
jgi:catechol 2,3-dioxygenase-like lactoylglutathione lyase family enzyme